MALATAGSTGAGAGDDWLGRWPERRTAENLMFYHQKVGRDRHTGLSSNRIHLNIEGLMKCALISLCIFIESGSRCHDLHFSRMTEQFEKLIRGWGIVRSDDLLLYLIWSDDCQKIVRDWSAGFHFRHRDFKMSIFQKDTTDINQVKEIKRELNEADRIEDIHCHVFSSITSRWW